jgi:mRNA interferase MazF
VGSLAVGDVILVPFPYSNLQTAKRRPALVAGLAERGDVILCQITSQPFSSIAAVAIRSASVSGDGLARDSYARPDKLFTMDPALAMRRLGRLDRALTQEIRARISAIFRDEA